jgi:hypothetical protein
MIEYPIEYGTLAEKMIYMLHKSGPITKKEVSQPEYKISSIGQVICNLTSKGLIIDKNGLLTLSESGLSELVRIESKDMTSFSQKRVLSAFHADSELTVREVLATMKVPETSSRINTVRTRLRALIGLGKIVRVGTGVQKRILYAKASPTAGRVRSDSVGIQLRLLDEERGRKIALLKVFQTALPGNLTAEIGGCGEIVMRRKIYG